MAVACNRLFAMLFSANVRSPSVLLSSLRVHGLAEQSSQAVAMRLSCIRRGRLAQWPEHRRYVAGVTGSSPVSPIAIAGDDLWRMCSWSVWAGARR